MPNNLMNAQRALDTASKFYETAESKEGDAGAFYRELSHRTYEEAQIYGVIAIAEQLARIADLLGTVIPVNDAGDGVLRIDDGKP